MSSIDIVGGSARTRRAPRVSRSSPESFATASDPGQSLLTYTAEPRSPSHDALNLLASWIATANNLEQLPSTGDAEQAESVKGPD
jgi:hypothetical protein